MQHIPSIPAVGQGLSASWQRNQLKCMRENRVITGHGILTKQTSNGLLINLKGETKGSKIDGPNPFDVRWHVITGNSGFWEVYLPYGCVSIGGVAAKCVNDNSTYGGIKFYDWYRISDPQGGDAINTTCKGYIALQWTVYLLIKPWGRFKVSAKKDDYDTVSWTVPIASITKLEFESEDGEETPPDGHLSDSLMDGVSKVEEPWSLNKQFDIDFKIKKNEDGEDVVTTYLINLKFTIGRAEYVIADRWNITDWKEAWLFIGHKDETFSIKVMNEKDAKSKGGYSDDDQTLIKLYDFKDGVVVADYREKIPEMNFYTSKPQKPTEE